MGVVVNAEYLHVEMARRGWSHTDLARVARISCATVSGAMNGRPVSPTTVRLILVALQSAPVLDGVDSLLL